MTGTMFFNMLLNIGLLVLLATLLTNMASVRKLFRGENSTIIQKMALAVIFGAISIVSTYTGTKTGGDIFEAAIKERMMIRDCSSFKSLDGEYIRFCIMNPEDNTHLLKLLEQF